MIKLDWTIALQMVNFLILVWALNYVAYRPIRGILTKRKEKVDSLENGIDRFKNDAVEKSNAFQAGIREAREKGLKMREAMEEKARQEEQQMIERINEKARQDLEDLREKVSRETREVRQSLESQIEFFANEISKKMLGRTV